MDPNNIPRKLNKEEIDDILSVIPDIKSAAKNIGKYNRKKLQSMVKEQLKDILLTPLGIQDMKDEIVRQFGESIVKPGSMVGVTVAEALGGPITQMALNSIHSSGASKNVTHGVARIRELLNASLNPKKTSCSIYFKNQNLSFEDIIINKRPEIKEISVKDLVIGIPDIEETSEFVEPWWYNIYRELIRDDFDSKSFLRMKMDVHKMYANKIDMEKVCKTIEIDQPVVCVYSTMNVGIIDIYPIESSIIGKLKNKNIVSNDNAAMIFLTMIIIPALDKLNISGIPGIQQLYPEKAPVWQIVKEERKYKDNIWNLILNKKRMMITGIKVQKLVRLCKLSGLTIIKEDKISETSDYISIKSAVKPSTIVNDMIKKDEEDEKSYEKNKIEEGAKITRRPQSDISIASTLIYADTDGSNLINLLSRPDIDSTRTYSNNIHEINNLLGIEAARSFYIQEFINVIGYEGSYVNPRHIVLLVDYMTSLGKISGITFSGISKQPIGAFAKASVERAMDTFKEAAGFGETDKVVGTSASIYVGKKALIGTGYSDQFMDSSKYDELQKELNEDPKYKLDVDNFNNAIEDLEDMMYGLDATLEDIEEEMFGSQKIEIPEELEPLSVSEPVMTNIKDGGNLVPDERLNQQTKGYSFKSQDLIDSADKLMNDSCFKEQSGLEDVTPAPEFQMFDLEDFMK